MEIRAGDVFYIPPGDDGWVVGNEPFVSLHLMGAGDSLGNTRNSEFWPPHEACEQKEKDNVEFSCYRSAYCQDAAHRSA